MNTTNPLEWICPMFVLSLLLALVITIVCQVADAVKEAIIEWLERR